MPTAVPTSGRQMPFFGNPDFRLHEFNKRLQQKCEETDNIIWDNLITEFFEEDASLTIQFSLEDGPKKYSIGRTLIPRYFRSLFEGGVSSLFYHLEQPKESFQESAVTLDYEKMAMVTSFGKPVTTKVFTEGHLSVEFTLDNLLRIRHWLFDIKHYEEMVPRAVVASDDETLEKLAKNITRQGLTNFTMNYLRLCVILEPMQEMMSKHKTYNMTPRGETSANYLLIANCYAKPSVTDGLYTHLRTIFQKVDCALKSIGFTVIIRCWSQTTQLAAVTISNQHQQCLKSVLFQKWQARMAGRQDCQGPHMDRVWKNNTAEGGQKAVTKRRKRKGSSIANENSSAKLGNATTAAGGGAGEPRSAKRKTSTPISRAAAPIQQAGSDVMLVGEPTLLVGEFGAEDERVITRIENPQYVATNGIRDDDSSFHGSPMTSTASWSSDNRKVVKEEKISD
eukprot:gene5278-5945_t